MNNKSIEQWAKEHANKHVATWTGPAKKAVAFGYKSGAAKQKELSDEREKLLLGVIEKLLSSIDVALYNQENNIGCDQCVNNAWVASDLKEELNDVKQTLKQINGVV